VNGPSSLFTPKFYHSKSTPYSRLDDYYSHHASHDIYRGNVSNTTSNNNANSNNSRSSGGHYYSSSKSSYYNENKISRHHPVDLRHQLNKTYYQQHYQENHLDAKEDKYLRSRDDRSDSDRSSRSSDRKLKAKKRLKDEVS